jgi:magnesium-transporting ATPase (P-type)
MVTNTGLLGGLQCLIKEDLLIYLFIKHILDLSQLFYYRLLLQASITLILAILVLSSSYNFLQVANALLSLQNISNSMSSKFAVLRMLNLQMEY